MKVVSIRRSRHSIKNRHYIVTAGKTRKEAEKLIGKNIVWKSPAGKEIKGTIKAAHGNKGCVRAIMEKGLPGQSYGTEVKQCD